MSRLAPRPPVVGPTLSKESAKELMTLLREPRLEARAMGSRAFHQGGSNPFDEGTPEAVSWQAGWDTERQENS